MKFPSILLAAVLVATPQLAAADTASVNIALITWADEWIGPALSEPMRVAAQQGGHSPLAMFMGADIVVKAVMFGLAIASVLGWAVWAGKILQQELSLCVDDPLFLGGSEPEVLLETLSEMARK